jgi:cytosine permease
VLVLNNLGLLAPAVVVLGLALWTTTDNNIYSSSLAFTNASKTAGLNISKPIWTIICVIIAVVVSFMGLAANFVAWLRFIGVLCGPLTGMLIAHFLVINRSGQYFVPKTARLSGWLAWIVSGIGALFSFSAIPSILAIVLGFTSYIIFYFVFDRKHKGEMEGETWSIPLGTEIEAAVKRADERKR